jgi:hypothetical protein
MTQTYIEIQITTDPGSQAMAMVQLPRKLGNSPASESTEMR